jgi:hypothetical protein
VSYGTGMTAPRQTASCASITAPRNTISRT